MESVESHSMYWLESLLSVCVLLGISATASTRTAGTSSLSTVVSSVIYTATAGVTNYWLGPERKAYILPCVRSQGQ